MANVYAPLKPISNGAKATHPPAQRTSPGNPELTTVDSAKSSSQVTRLCSQCRRVLSPGSVYKWCERCRQKDREKAKRKKQRALERAAQANAPSIPMTPDAIHAPMELDEPDMDVEMHTSGDSDAIHLPAKRKVSEVESDSDVLEAQPSHATLRTEYQTEQLFLAALSERMQAFQASRASVLSAAHPGAPSYVNFHWSYTIVMDPDISAARRAKRVKADLIKSTPLKFGDLIKHENAKTIPGHARTYWCACNPAPKPCPPSAILTPTPTPSSTQPATIRRTQSTLKNWLSQPAASSPKTEPVKIHTPPPGCGGTITLYVVEDASHPLASMGMRGQRIAVLVQHPGRDVHEPFAFN